MVVLEQPLSTALPNDNNVISTTWENVDLSSQKNHMQQLPNVIYQKKNAFHRS